MCRYFHRLLLLAVAIATGFPSLSSAQSDGLKFMTDKGPVRCTTSSTAGIDCLGIPYASPPVGDLRLRAPAPMPSWSGERDATRVTSDCLQAKSQYWKAQSGSEDCLYLNVHIPPHADKMPRPVIVWMHGGGFVNGSGNAFYGAPLARTANAIVVSVNYRLGPFGWLALPSLAAEAQDRSTGNYGLLDNLAALAWVKRNIGAFGGDPDRVVISGQSAGGEQVFAMLASPYAKGLFSGAISMSAPSSIPLPTIEAAAAKRVAFLNEIGCGDATDQTKCLRGVSAQKMLDAAHVDWDLVEMLGLQFTPTIDGVVLTAQWQDLFRSGQFNRVPVIIGHTKAEGRLFVALHENGTGAPMTDEIVDSATRRFFGPAYYAIRQIYPASAYDKPSDRGSAVITDALFAAGLTANRNALSSGTAVFAYESCDQDAPESHVHAEHMKLMCAHDSDLHYLFQWDDFERQAPELTVDQQKLAVLMGRYWGQFAANGNPNGDGLPHWPTYSSENAVVQLLEPATTGGVRASAPGAYADEHRLGFWMTLSSLRRPAVWVGISIGMIVAIGIVILLFRRRFRALIRSGLS